MALISPIVQHTNQSIFKYKTMACARMPAVPVIKTEYDPAGVPPLPVRLVVWISSAELAEPDPGVTLEGVNWHVDSAGRFEQFQETLPARSPYCALAVTVDCAVFPALIVTAEGATETTKSTPVPESEPTCGLPEALSEIQSAPDR